VSIIQKIFTTLVCDILVSESLVSSSPANHQELYFISEITLFIGMAKFLSLVRV